MEKEDNHQNRTFLVFATPERVGKTNSGNTQTTKHRDNRGRTPSGQVFANSYSDIRELFQKQINTSKANSEHVDHEKSVSPERKCKRTVTISQPEPINEHDDCDLNSHQHDQSECKQIDWALETEKHYSFEEANQNKMSGAEERETIAEQDFNKILATENNSQRQALINKCPKTMDVLTVLKMFEEIKLSIESNTRKIDQAAQMVPAGDEEGQSLEVSKLKEELSNMKKKNRFLNGHLGRVTQEMKEMQHRIEMLEINCAKRMIILNGLQIRTKKNEGITDLENFFKNYMRIEPTIEDFFVMNSQGNIPGIVVTLLSTYDKQQIYRNVDKLPKKQDPAGGKPKPMYTIRDYHSAASNEKRRRERDIMSNFKQEDGAKTEDMEYGKGGIYYKQQLYTKMVPPPDPTSILRMSVATVENIFALPITSGKEIKFDGNTFYPYTVEANSPEDVQKAYLHVKLQHPSARHIVCAYRLPGYPLHQYNDYQDDEEHGAGAKILQLLANNNITNRAVYVARYCSKHKIGNKRYEQYVDAVKSVINATAENTLIKQVQRTTVDNYETGKTTRWEKPKTPYKQQHKPVRGHNNPFRRGAARSPPFEFQPKSTTMEKRLNDTEWPPVSPPKEMEL